jgi:hypothetical protein
VSKSKPARTVSCGGCGQDGHNKRTCPSRTSTTPAAPIAVAEPPKKVVEAAKPTPPNPRAHKPPTRQREAPTGDRGTAATAAPYRCPKCNSVAILVIVRVKDYVKSQQQGKDVFKGDQRCEQCMNKPDPCSLILVWGASPGQTVTEQQANASV